MSDTIRRSKRPKINVKTEIWVVRSRGEMRRSNRKGDDVTHDVHRNLQNRKLGPVWARKPGLGGLYLTIRPADIPDLRATLTHLAAKLPTRFSTFYLHLPTNTEAISNKERIDAHCRAEEILRSGKATESLICSTLSGSTSYWIHGATIGIADLHHPFPPAGGDPAWV